MKEQKIEEMRIAAQKNGFVVGKGTQSEYDLAIHTLVDWFDCNIINDKYYLYSYEGSVIETNSDPQKIIDCINQILNS